MNRLWAVFIEAHKHIDTYFTYVVAASVTLQASWQEMDDYIPPKYRHYVIGGATAIVVFDRMLKSIKATKPE